MSADASGEIGTATRRTVCPVCGKRVPITAGGTFRKHSTYATACPQSGSEPPKERA